MYKGIGIFFLLLSITLFSACEEPIISETNDNFDRVEMMEVWVDDYISNGYRTYISELTNLQLKHSEFKEDVSLEKLSAMREAFIDAYTSWQLVAMYEIGEAEKVGLRNYTNIFPTDLDQISNNINTGDYNLALPSSRPAQGFPALDYILFNTMGEDALLSKLSEDNCSQYIDAIIARLVNLGIQVKDSWDAERRSLFTANKESADRMINDFLYYYEKFLRAGKIGIPAGVFSGERLPGNVEAPYSGIHSRKLLLASLDAVQSFFNSRNGMASYLAFMEKGDIAAEINQQWDLARQMINQLNPNLKEQVESDNIKMLEVYDELQKAVVLLKVDMLQALSIQVDYVDADGD